MAEKVESHPLDDFEFGKADETSDARNQPYQPLFKRSLLVAGMAFFVLFLASLAASNSADESSVNQVAHAINYAATMILLGACCAMLVAYAIPRFDGQLASQRFTSFRERLTRDLPLLMLSNAIGLVILWGLVLAFAIISSPVLSVILMVGIYLFTGLAATMAVWHKGTLRAYMIGVLTVLFLSTNNNVGILMIWGGMRGNPYLSMSIGSAGIITLAAVSGLICAAYVAVIDRKRSDGLR
jgi:hypothetical protein